MPVYSKVIPNEHILDMLSQDYKNILILGCGGCMNESLAFTYSQPLILHNDIDIFPSIDAECVRIKTMLESNGFSVVKIILEPASNSRCIRDMNEEQYTIPKSIKPDMILVLSCPSGYWGLSSVIKGIPMLNITKQVGMLFYRYNDNGKERHIVFGKYLPFTAQSKDV